MQSGKFLNYVSLKQHDEPQIMKRYTNRLNDQIMSVRLALSDVCHSFCPAWILPQYLIYACIKQTQGLENVVCHLAS